MNVSCPRRFRSSLGDDGGVACQHYADLVGIGTFVLGGPAEKWVFYNNLLAVLAMLVLLAVVLVSKFSRFLVISNHRVLAAGTLIFALEVAYTLATTQ